MADAKAESSVDSSALIPNSGNVSSQTNNPLARKLNKILETRLDNDKVSESLIYGVLFYSSFKSAQLANVSLEATYS